MILIIIDFTFIGSVAQPVERRDDNSKVGGSNPPFPLLIFFTYTTKNLKKHHSTLFIFPNQNFFLNNHIVFHYEA